MSFACGPKFAHGTAPEYWQKACEGDGLAKPSVPLGGEANEKRHEHGANGNRRDKIITRLSHVTTALPWRRDDRVRRSAPLAVEGYPRKGNRSSLRSIYRVVLGKRSKT